MAEYPQAEEIVFFNAGKVKLSTLGIDALPAEEASIDRPRARSNHCESDTEGSQQYADPQIVAAREHVS